MEQFDNFKKINKNERLISSEDDETLGDVEYFLHGTNSLLDTQTIQQEGLSVREGRSTVSTDLAHSLSWAMGEHRHFSESETPRADNEVGKIFVIKKPNDLRIDYGLFTDSTISRTEITGFPLKYASGRKQLAFYRVDTSKEVLVSQKADERAQLVIAPEQIELVIAPTKELANFVDKLSIKTKRLEAVDINNYSGGLADILKLQHANKTPDELSLISRQLILATIESIVISKLRNLYLDILASKGYEIYENGQQQDMARDLTSLKTEVTELYDKSHASDFDIGVEWLNRLIPRKTQQLLDELL